MLSRRNVSILSILALTSLILFQFQNCAPAAKPTSFNSRTPDVRLVDDFNKSEIQFVAPEVQMRDDALAADVAGLCNRSHNGAILSWSLWASSGDVLAKGESRCGGGGFAVHMDGLGQMACGVPFQLVIEGQWGGSAFTSFERRCQPLAREALAAADGAPLGTECQLEYALSDDSKAHCNRVCYRAGLLVSLTPAEPGQCDPMAARLAGP